MEALDQQAELALWEAMRSSQSQSARKRLLELYEPLARAIASRLYGGRADDSVPFGDYLQYGRLGLIEAVDRYDVAREAAFATFAGQRIRGSILNGLTKESESSAQRRFWGDRWQDRVHSLQTAVAPDADRASLADVVTITMGLAVGVIVEGLETLREPADLSPRGDPYAMNEASQLRGVVRKLILDLPERERAVITGHYVEQLEFQVLAQRHALTKGRISQIHAQALLRLRGWLEQRPSIDRRV